MQGFWRQNRRAKDMRFTEAKVEEINEVLSKKKKTKPISSTVTGIGVNIFNGVGKTIVARDNSGFCDIEDLGRMIEELQMLKEAIEEATGVEL